MTSSEIQLGLLITLVLVLLISLLNLIKELKMEALLSLEMDLLMAQKVYYKKHLWHLLEQ